MTIIFRFLFSPLSSFLFRLSSSLPFFPLSSFLFRLFSFFSSFTFLPPLPFPSFLFSSLLFFPSLHNFLSSLFSLLPSPMHYYLFPSPFSFFISSSLSHPSSASFLFSLQGLVFISLAANPLPPLYSPFPVSTLFPSPYFCFPPFFPVLPSSPSYFLSIPPPTQGQTHSSHKLSIISIPFCNIHKHEKL